MSNSKLSENALTIASNRYFFDEDEDWEKLSIRVGTEAARPENGERTRYGEAFAETIYNMDFLPGGRILRNTGRSRGSLFNCYVVPVGDSIEEIGEWIKDSLVLWSEGGGVGCNLSSLRPRGAIIKGKGGISSGPVSFLEASDGVANTIESGGSRRAAALACMNVSHPDILEFIDSKLTHGKLSHYNISVAVDEDFLLAVEKNDDWMFRFAQRDYGIVKAVDIWDKIVTNMVNSAEPGLLHWQNLTSNNSYYFDPILSTNPCTVGDTLVAVADGREAVSIRKLAEEGKDVPVFSFNRASNKPEVKMMRHPRVTGYNKKIFKVLLDDGSYIRCTNNHKLIMKDSSVKKVKDLKPGDKLHHMVKYHASFEEIFEGPNSKSNDYVWVNTGFSNTVAEHRLLAEFSSGKKIETGWVVHHKDYDSLNNSFDNLVIMSKADHDKLHSKDMLGEKNPMNRFPEKNWLIKQDHSGKNNGRYKGFEHKEIFEFMIEYMVILGRKITFNEWKEISKENNFPYSKYILGKFSSFDKMITEASIQADVYKSGPHLREYRKYLEIKDTTDLDVFFENGSIYTRKKCEYCGNDFIVKWFLRERSFCSRNCSSDYACTDKRSIEKHKNYYLNNQAKTREQQLNIFNELTKKLNRKPLKKEWATACRKRKVSYRIRNTNDSNCNEYCFTSYKEINEAASLNFTIVSIEEDGCEDVYNGTVDTNHNFYVLVNENKTKSGKKKCNYINNLQCGEVPLSAYGVCCLGSLVLPNFITGNINTNWKKLEATIKIAVRFLDDIIDINKYVLKEVDIKAHNGRRIGLGVMGLAEYLFAKEVRYGSKKAIDETEKLMRFIRDVTYETSIELAIEKGAFPKFDSVAYGKSHFIRSLPAKLRMTIKDKGIRNVTALAIAPTGTISLLPEVTSGIEPLFRKAYLRKDRVSERIYVHPIYKDLLENKEEVPHWFVDTDDLKPEDHLETQSVVQKYVDGAVSKTINMPKGTTADELSRLMLEYIHDLKGVTVYVDESREGQILNKITEEEVCKYIKENMVEASADVETTICATGSCEI